MSAAKLILDERPRIADALSARALVEAVLEALGSLSHLVGEETELVEQVKLNAVALARFVPDQVKRLKEAHLAFQGLIETNQIVLATARAVSESVIRDLAADANKPMRANGYGPAASVGAGAFARPNSGPLVVSRRL